MEQQESRRLQLSVDQENAWKQIKQGKNVFLTGAGGTGKTFFLHYLYHQWWKEFSSCPIQFCALTGCAAVLLKECHAQTIHSFMGIGIGTRDESYYLRKMPQWKKKQLRELKCLVVDEISMMSPTLFELIHRMFCHIRRSSLPFGGVQVVGSGDFFQLGPILSRVESSTSSPKDVHQNQNQNQNQKLYCFQHSLWSSVFLPKNYIFFSYSFRHELPTVSSENEKQQKEQWKQILSEVRQGFLSDSSFSILQSRLVVDKDDMSFLPETCVRLFPRKYQVETYNDHQLLSLPGKEHEYQMIPVLDPQPSSNIKKNGKPSTESFTMEQKQHELVMMQKELNMSSPLILKPGAHVMCLINIRHEGTQELILCNGSQGRVIRCDEGRVTVSFPETKIGEYTFDPYFWESERIPGIGWKQIPLCLSWAMTIHKCQGLTLPYACMDLGSMIFDYGQMYVALSRVTKLSGLFLLSLSRHSIKTHPDVLHFYTSSSFL